MAKNVIHFDKAPTIGAAEGRENQRRWTEDDYKRFNSRPRNWYDFTRRNLNFEVDSMLKVRPSGTSAPVDVAFQKRMEELGAKMPKTITAKSHIRVVKFILSGDTEVMRNLAFGSQTVDFGHGDNVDNSRISRCQRIERWAIDARRFMAKRYGDENIIGFDVHLDENSPHIHCTIIPVTPDGKVNFKQVFCPTREAGSKYLRDLHTDYWIDVGENYGLTRGDDISGRDVRHIDKAEYYAILTRKCKGLTTMIENLEVKKKAYEKALAGLYAEYEDSSRMNEAEKARMQSDIDRIHNELDRINGQLTGKKSLLSEAEKQLADVKQDNERLFKLNETLRTEFNEAVVSKQGKAKDLLAVSAFETIINEFIGQYRQLPEESRMVFENSLLNDLAEHGNSIIKCGLMLCLGMTDRAESYAVSNGGGGSGNCSDQSPWGEKEHEMDRKWAMECMRRAQMMLRKPKERTIRYGRGR